MCNGRESRGRKHKIDGKTLIEPPVIKQYGRVKRIRDGRGVSRQGKSEAILPL